MTDSNKRWAVEGCNHVLYFTPFHDEEQIAVLSLDDDGDWCYSSKMLGVYNEYMFTETLEDSKAYVETCVVEYYESQIGYYTELKRLFEEGKDG